MKLVNFEKRLDSLGPNMFGFWEESKKLFVSYFGTFAWPTQNALALDLIRHLGELGYVLFKQLLYEFPELKKWPKDVGK